MNKPAWLTRSLMAKASAAVFVVIVMLFIYKPGWTGFWAGSTTTRELDSTGTVTKTVEVEQSGKTLWDWLSVLGIPLSLAVLGIWFQQLQQKRTEEETKEEALQVYFDRISALLVDKNLMAIGANRNPSSEQKELLDSSVDVIRARTLSILRRFGDDAERKSSVVLFLIEADIIGKLKLSLSRANLSCANLRSAYLRSAYLRYSDLSRANLMGADLNSADLRFANLNSADLRYSDFRGADLIGADLIGADLSGVDLSGADLSGAILIGANLIRADLNGANLSDANLRGANLSSTLNCTEEQLSSAKLCQTQLPQGCKLDPDRNRAELKAIAPPTKIP